MKLTFLGTGTSQGVPVIGMNTPVAHSRDKRDKRLRTSALLSWGGVNVAIDCSPDFRQQMLSHKVQHFLPMNMQTIRRDWMIYALLYSSKGICPSMGCPE